MVISLIIFHTSRPGFVYSSAAQRPFFSLYSLSYITSKSNILIHVSTMWTSNNTSTGNGKCNFTNESCRVVPSGENSDFCFIPNPEGIPPFYSADNSGFAEKVISRFDSEDALKFFRDLGLLPLNKNGYFYQQKNYIFNAVKILSFLFCRIKNSS